MKDSFMSHFAPNGLHVKAKVAVPHRHRARAMPNPAAHPTIVSFDVDGTLVRSVGKDANKLHKEAFAEGLKVLGIDDERGIDVIEHHGSTDGLILVRTAHFHGLDPALAMDRLPEMHEAMISHFRRHRHRATYGIEVLPGVEALLQALAARADVLIGLTTGNLVRVDVSPLIADR